MGDQLGTFGAVCFCCCTFADTRHTRTPLAPPQPFLFSTPTPHTPHPTQHTAPLRAPHTHTQRHTHHKQGSWLSFFQVWVSTQAGAALLLGVVCPTLPHAPHSHQLAGVVNTCRGLHSLSVHFFCGILLFHMMHTIVTHTDFVEAFMGHLLPT